MANVYCTFDADTVAKVGEAQITSNDVSTTYKLLVGDVTISTAGNAGGASSTATDLAAAWNASTHPYCTGITASTSTDKVILTADTAGVDYTITSAVSGGTGTIGAFTVTTSNGGPNDLSDANNWSGGALPGAGDTAILQNNDVNACWGLDFTGAAPNEWIIERTYTGLLGLHAAKFATSADAETFSTTEKHEYRQAYLLSPGSDFVINRENDFTTDTGGKRIKVDSGSTAATIRVHGSNAAAQDKSEGFPVIMVLANNASSELHIDEAKGGIGVGIVGNESGQFGEIRMAAPSTATSLVIGNGITIGNYRQTGGACQMSVEAATVTEIRVSGGELTTYGDGAITTTYAFGGVYNANHVAASGAEIVTLNLDGGEVNGMQVSEARTWTTVNHIRGTLRGLRTVTITNYNVGSSSRGPEVVEIADA